MFDKPQPFLQLTLPRVINAMQRVQKQIWEDPQPVKLSYGGHVKGGLSAEEAAKLNYEPASLPFHWGRFMYSGWFKLEFPAAEGKTRWLHWRDQGEGTLYVDGTPVYGFDVAHRQAPLPDGCTEALMEGLCLQSGIWHPEATGIDPAGSKLTVAEVSTRNEVAWKAYFDLEVLFNLVKDEGTRTTEFGGLQNDGVGNKPKLETVSPLLRRAMRVLDDAVMAYDKGGLSALTDALADGYTRLKGAPGLVKALLSGHAHIDLVWLWNEFSGEYKARHTFASMNTLMDLYPEFHFAYSQSASYDAVNRTAPRLLEKVKQRVTEGRWEPVGSTYVESDTMMACGEALTRSFLVGQERFRALFGDTSRLLWLPDVFGYCGCLPQIMRQCGVDRFFTTKLTWSNIQLFPYSSFAWRGVDGSEVLTHVTQGLGYNLNANPGEIRKGAIEYRQSDVHDTYLQPTGFGDGGGGVTLEMCERARRQTDLAGVPSASWGRLEDFYDQLDSVRDRLPVYQGELYLEYHRGTLTTHGDLKRDFRALERALMLQEAAHALTGAGAIPVHAWQRLVFSQFHDYIPGSSIHEVYEEGLPELRDLAAQAIEAGRATLGDGSCTVNLLTLTRPLAVKGKEGTGLVQVPPLSSVDAATLPVVRPLPEPKAGALSLDSERVQARFNQQGEVIELVIDGETVAQSAPLNQFTTYADWPHQFDAWDIDRQTLHIGEPVTSPAEVVPFAPDEGAGLAFRRSIGKQSTAEIRYSVDAVLPVLKVEVVLDWQDEHCLLKAVFPTCYTGRFARYGAPFNSVLRGQLAGDPKDEAMFETCGSRWAVVMDDSQSAGLAVMTRDKFGFSCRDGSLGLSVVRSVPVTGEDPAHRRVVVCELRDGDTRPVCSDIGTHSVQYAMGRFGSDLPREDAPAALADLLYTPLLSAPEPVSVGLLGLDGGNSLIPHWAKPLENGGWILRLHEVLGRSGSTRLALADGWQAQQTSLDETLEGETGDLISFRPYEIVSVRLTRI